MTTSVKTGELTKLSDLSFDEFECHALDVLRFFWEGFYLPESQSWRHGYSLAIDYWGETMGLAAAHRLQKLAEAIHRCCGSQFSYVKPFGEDLCDCVTHDEEAAIEMLHFMRREETTLARNAVDDLTRSHMDPDIIRTALAFAERFSCGPKRGYGDQDRPKLRLIAF